LVVDGHGGKEAQEGAFFRAKEEQEPEKLDLIAQQMIIIYSRRRELNRLEEEEGSRPQK